MALVDVRSYNLNPNILGSFASGQQFGQQLGQQDRAAQIRGLLAQQQQMQPQTQQQQMLAEQSAGFGTQQALAEQPQPVMSQEEMIKRARAIDPEQANKILTSMGLDEPSKREEFSRFAAQLQSVPYEQRGELINARAQRLQSEGRNPAETLKLLELDQATQDKALTGVQLMDLSTKERFAVKESMATQGLGGKIGTYNPRDYTVPSFAEFRRTGDPAVLERYTEKTVDVGGVPHLFDPVSETYKPIVPTEKVASNKAKIASAIKQAEAESKGRGESFDAYNRAKAALPGLQEVANKLSKLSDIATYTTTGKAFNFMVKELGFGATEGGTARASMVALVNNQVLPLLRETFGAAFTQAEGESLKATLLDVDASPEEKKATLNSFIDQKIRNLQTSERELGIETQTPPAVKNVTTMTDEELAAEAARLRGQQ